MTTANQELHIDDNFVIGIENVTNEAQHKHEIFIYMLCDNEHEVKKLAEINGEVPVDIANMIVNISGLGWKAMFYASIAIESIQKKLHLR